MPRKKPDVPPFKVHKATGQGYVYIDGRRRYLGRHDTEEAKLDYARLIAEWTAGRGQPLDKPSDLTILELTARFWQHAEAYYRKPDGTPTSTLHNYGSALRHLKKLYARSTVSDFTPQALKAVRQSMIDAKWTRGTINKTVHLVRNVFRWGVAEGIVPQSVFAALQAVSGLRRGRCDAREGEAVRPVPQHYIDAIKPYVSRQVWTLIQLQLRTAARAGELVRMRPVDIDMTGRIWTYTPAEHKTAHHGHRRTIYIGPSGQEIIRPFLANRPVDAFLFSPAEAEADRRAERHGRRKTPLSCGNRPGSNRSRFPRRKPGDHYGVGGYRRAISHACDKAFPAPKEFEAKARKQWCREHRWHPHQLRHNAATMLRKEFDLEVARIILGHRSPAITEVYAELDHQKAIEVIARIG